MSTRKIAAIVLIGLGVLALTYGGLTYTRETHEAHVGPLEVTIKDKKTINIPVWAGVGAIGIGAYLLIAGKRN